MPLRARYDARRRAPRGVRFIAYERPVCPPPPQSPSPLSLLFILVAFVRLSSSFDGAVGALSSSSSSPREYRDRTLYLFYVPPRQQCSQLMPFYVRRGYARETPVTVVCTYVYVYIREPFRCWHSRCCVIGYLRGTRYNRRRHACTAYNLCSALSRVSRVLICNDAHTYFPGSSYVIRPM